MYLSFYSLDKKPFQISTEPNFLWLGEIHKEALSILRYGVMSRNGFLTLTGDIGTGKTTLINALLAELNSNVTAAHISYTSIDVIGFLNLIGHAFQISEIIDRTEDFIYPFSKFLERKFYDNCHVLLVIDEAHKLSQEILEHLRLLSNLEMIGQNLISFFLVGQNELNKKLLSPNCKALRQRITIHYQLKPLSEIETLQYCNHRLNIAGSKYDIFNKQAIHEIYRFSKGYPRLINIICEQALIAGYVKETREISPEIIKDCSRELRLPGETMIRLKLDFKNQLMSASNLVSRLGMRSKVLAVFGQLKRYTRLFSMYLVDRFRRGGLFGRLINSVMVKFDTAVDYFKLSDRPNKLTIQSLGDIKKLISKLYGLKKSIHNFSFRLTDSGINNNTLAVRFLILAFILSFWYQALLTFKSNPPSSDNLDKRFKLSVTRTAEEHAVLVPNLYGLDTAAESGAVKKPPFNLELNRADSIEKNTEIDKKNNFNPVVDFMEYSDMKEDNGALKNNKVKNQFDRGKNGENVYPGKILETVPSKIESDESQISARKSTNMGKQDRVKLDSLPDFSNRSKTLYSVQIGAFLSNKNALRRAGILEKKGYLTRIVKFRDAGGRIWYTVRCGAYDSLRVAWEKARALSSKEKLKSTVRRSDRL